MGGINTRNRAFKIATVKMHLLSESGSYPLYRVTDKDGIHDAITGSWNVGEVSQEEARRGTRITGRRPDGVINSVPIIAVPPACPDGGEVAPMNLIVRNINSPDAEETRKKLGIDTEDIAKRIKNGTEQTDKVKAIPMDERQRIIVSSAICGFENLLYEDEKTKETGLLEYTPENAVLLLKDHEAGLTQVDEFVGDTKKFESRS